MTTATKVPRRPQGERLAALPAHEAFAVFRKTYEELLYDAQRLAKRIEEFEGLDGAHAEALGNERAAAAGHALFMDDHPDNARCLI